MKLLFDQNLSHRLVELLRDVFPDSNHVRNVGLSEADDRAIWSFAMENGFTIVSKDDDFHQLSFLHGAPPKVIWLRLGNCSTTEIASCMRTRFEQVTAFDADLESTFLSLS